MPVHTHPEYRKPVLVLRATGNERRFALLVLLLKVDFLICSQAAEFLGVNLAAASKHLHLLLRAGLIVSKRNGGSVEFRISPGMQKTILLALHPLLKR